MERRAELLGQRGAARLAVVARHRQAPLRRNIAIIRPVAATAACPARPATPGDERPADRCGRGAKRALDRSQPAQALQQDLAHKPAGIPAHLPGPVRRRKRAHPRCENPVTPTPTLRRLRDGIPEPGDLIVGILGNRYSRASQVMMIGLLSAAMCPSGCAAASLAEPNARAVHSGGYARASAGCGFRSGAAVRKDAELVPLWVGKHDPALIALADVGVSSA
jgi:hypothetical protein